MNPKPATQPIKILQRTYHLPVLTGDSLKQLQASIQNRQQAIRTGEEIVVVQVQQQEQVPGGLLGLGRKTVTRTIRQRQRKPLDMQQRFQYLEAQIRDYDVLLRLLKQHRVAYQRFFLDLSKEVQQLIETKCQQMAALEAKRQQIETQAQAKGNQGLLAMTLSQKRQVIDSLLMLDKAAVLMLKKVSLISEGIAKLTQDSELSKQVLENMMAELRDYREAIVLQRELDALQQEITQFTQVALDLEHYLQQYLGPFQALIEDAAQVDGQLAQTVEEIRNLAEDLMGAQGGWFDVAGAEQLTESLLTLEVARIQKQERLGDALEMAGRERLTGQFRAANLSDRAVAAVEIGEQIAAIQGHVQRQLVGLQGTMTVEIEAEIEADPDLGAGFYGLSATSEPITFELPKQGGTLELVPVPAGELVMVKGSHRVQVPEFSMGKFPVTQRQYQAIIGQNPSKFGDNPEHPVETVTWHQAMAFCRKLTKLLQLTDQVITLPSETMWEWAAREAENSSLTYAVSNDLDQVGWYKENSSRTTHPVGQKDANKLGIHDMSGNVWEWCQDNWASSTNELSQDGKPLLKGGDNTLRAVRGGSWFDYAVICSSGNRDFYDPGCSYGNQGFRVVLLPVGFVP
ncbi:formylglycine-generating enzyme family protein [Prochlorothrix hollandica]|uniref:Sulfatase-modifying factor enzyme-like domain-containing protein n=1 Tax=Prochlorothrix hollandica PCC 9006 = CALU 1027 TaxID=317619 RepID=A0A0M2Q2M1_PROHO|nr:formylglycine-generating enzyme family protein [Prochlorothrix hollandica]KKJ01513.1 hypothetical protein PROH_04180 [Prochlorothrix hollandica PCC 9006 = CALU 1027]